MKKRIFSLLVALTLLAPSLNVSAFAVQGDEDALNAQYTYTNNGYTLEKVSHADVAAGDTDGFVDYYQYTDPDGKICTGVTEHVYTGNSDTPACDTDAELAKLKSKLEDKYPNARIEEIDRMTSEIKESLTGDACQSYAFSALGHGDWVYIGTMYGGTGITKNNARTMFKSLDLLKDETNEDGTTNQEAVDYNQKLVDSAVGLLYGDNYYTEHPVPTQGILFKMNVKTGESKILMAGSVNGYQVTLRNAVAYNGRFYFIGTQVGTESVADAATGIPSIFEVNPEDDSFRTVYQAVTMDEYREMQAANVFPIPRAITVYKGSLIASVTKKDGAHIIAYTPDADDFNADGSFRGIKVEDGSALRNPEFTEIAEQSVELLNYPAYHTYDANYGGTVYQMIEYNDKLYMAINAGQKALHSTLNPTEGVYTAVDPDTREETKCFAGYAILEGALKDGASPSDRDAWTWTPIIGNTKDDQWDNSINRADTYPAMYTFNIDPNRFAAAICTMEVYNGYLYIGDYNDVTQATYPMLQMDFIHLATVLSQSVNLYRMDKDYSIDLVVGDKTKTFQNGSLSGWESGYTGLNGHGSRINQYTSMTQIWDEDKTDDNDGVMLLGTLDEGSLLRPLVKITNGDVLKMDKDEWSDKINYLKVLIQLLLEKNSLSGDGAAATADLSEEDGAASSAAPDSDELTAEELVKQALDAANAYDSMSGAEAASGFDLYDDDSISIPADPVTLTSEQTASLVEGIRNGTINPHSMSAESTVEALSLSYGMSKITNLVDANGQENINAFSEIYEEIVNYYQDLMGQGDVVFPEPLQNVLDQLLTEENAKQLKALLTCLNAVKDSVVGCDTYAITTDDDGSNLKIGTITLDGLGDDSNQTMRNFAITDDYVVFIPGNAIRGGSVYRLANWPGKTDSAPEPTKYNVTLSDAGVGATGAGSYTEGDIVKIYAGTKSGYTFDGWISDDVTISDASNTTVSFAMPDKNVNVKARWTYSGSSGGHSGGSGSGSTTYSITVKDSKNGDVASSRKTASSGTIVILTVEPDQGWTLETLTVLNANGKELDLNIVKIGEKYTFKMPDNNVTVEATFKPIASPVFTDVPSGSYYEEAVKWAVENGITTGTSATAFDPNGICTRAQAVTFLWRAAGSPAPKRAAMPFTDVPAGSYYYDAVLWAVENGITKGTSDTTFSPNENCSRAQIVTFLWRSQKSPAAGSVNPFTDVTTNVYYANAVLWAVNKDVTKGTSNTTFGPDADCTRAQIVTFIWRTLA